MLRYFFNSCALASSDSPRSQNTGSPVHEETSHADENNMEVVTTYQENEVNVAANIDSPEEKIQNTVKVESPEDDKMEVEGEEIEQDIGNDDNHIQAKIASQEEPELTDVKEEPKSTDQLTEMDVVSPVAQQVEDNDIQSEEKLLIEDKQIVEKKEENEENKVSNDEIDPDENSETTELSLPRKRGNRRNGNSRKRCRSDSTALSSNDQSIKSNSDNITRISTSTSTTSNDSSDDNSLAFIINGTSYTNDMICICHHNI